MGWSIIFYPQEFIPTPIQTFRVVTQLHILDLTINSSSSVFVQFLHAIVFAFWMVQHIHHLEYIQTPFTNNTGCDSIHTLDLTISYSSSGQSVITTCNSYSWNGTLYTSSGTYTNTYINTAFCDSLSHTLYLTIDPFYSGDSKIRQ